MRRASMLLAAAAVRAAAPALADITRVSPPVPETATSKIFGRSTVPGSPQSVDLAAPGYVEREYFVTGTANAYAHQPDGRIAVEQADIPYVTRIIVRMPKDPKRFSGVVHIEPIHPMQGGQSNWFATASYVMRSGDAYVAAGLGDDPGQRAASAKGPVPTAQSQVTKWFDPQRYAALDWPAEDGIRFEVMADIGKLLRGDRPDNPLRHLKVRSLFAEGWSFTGSFMRTFIDEGFHDRTRLPDGKPVFDGYLIGISSRWNGGGYLPLNTHEKPAPNDSPRRDLKPIDAPVIEFMSEFEPATGPGPQVPDSDRVPGQHRIYQLGGVIHSESLNDHIVDRVGKPNLTQLAQKGYPFAGVGTEAAGQGKCPLPISDLPHGALARAAMDNLKRWADDGVPPPHAALLERNPDQSIRRDSSGNPMGGIRVAEFEVPLARYDIYRGGDKPACVATSGRPIILRQEFSRDDLIRRYGSAARYDARYDAAIDRMVAGHWLLPEDAKRLKAKTAAKAAADFGGTK
jgi:hypothetical protein